MANIDELVTEYQDKQGSLTTDATTRARQKRLIVDILAELFPKVPSQWFRQVWTTRLEPIVDLSSYYGAIWDETTPRFIYFSTTPASGTYTALASGVLATNGTINNRYLEVYRASDGKYIYRKVRQVVDHEVPNIFGPVTHYRGVVIDEPWENGTDVDLRCRILTLEYPLPMDVAKIDSLRWSIDGTYGGISRMYGVGPTTLDMLRLGVAQRSGTPSIVSLSQTQRLKAPHWIPTVAVTPIVIDDYTTRWGYDSSGIERGSSYTGQQYGAAGTFSYVVVTVWGRRPWWHPTKGWGFLGPWLCSPPSVASAQVSTTWGLGMIEIRLANVEYIQGYAAEGDSPCKNASGLEHWIFRARHATQSPTTGANHAAEKYIEADGVPYLWRILTGSTTLAYDRGDDDPVDVDYPLKDYSPQSCLAFDVVASQTTIMQASVVVRPPKATNDADTIEIPEGFRDVIINRMVYYLQARREADRGLMKQLDEDYEKLLRGLRRQGPFLPEPGAGGQFENGLSLTSECGFGNRFGPLVVVDP